MESLFMCQRFHQTMCLQSFSIYFMCILWKQIQRCSDQKRNNKILKFHENHEIFFSSTFSFNSVFTKLQHLFHVRPVETTIEVLRSQKEQKKSRD